MNIWGFNHHNKLKLGAYGYHPFRRAFRLAPFHINSHMHVMGITGAGKSKFLTQLMLELHRTGRAFTLIDPAGDLARDVLKHLVAHGTYRDARAFERILYLDLPAAERRDL